jgi:hypothetical protein
VSETDEISDGYHTFGELYDHRAALFIALMLSHPDISWFSDKHDDGSVFDGDRFFGGHEIRAIREHRNSRPYDDMGKEFICPRCTAAGVGCVAWAIEGQPHVGCPFAPIDLRDTK